MEHIITIQQGIIDWLRVQAFSPALRSIDCVNQPVATYPQASVSLGEEAFWPGQADTTARLSIELNCAAGRPRDAQAAAASLAHQVRRALNGSHCLGGLVKQLAVERITYTQPEPPPGAPVVVRAGLQVLLRYVDDGL